MPSKIFLLFIFFTLSFQLDLQGVEVLQIGRGDQSPSFNVAPNSKIALKFSSNPTTGSDWYLLNSAGASSAGLVSFLNLNENKGGEYVPDRHERRIVGSGGNTYFVVQVNGSLGEVELRFEYKRIWEKTNMMEKNVVLKIAN